MNILNYTNIEILKVEESEHDFIFTVRTIKNPMYCNKCFCKADGNLHKHGSRKKE